MNKADYDYLAQYLHESSGLVLTEDKSYLIESRLLPVIRRHNLATLEEMVQKIRSRQNHNLMRDVTEAMTTNESSFFRDLKPFDLFKDVMLPYFLQARNTTKRIRIWSGASSSGQEAYSMAILLKEQEEKLRGWNIEIIGTDLSSEMVERAKSGIYTQFEVQRGMPVHLIIKYFKQAGDRWQIAPEIRAMAQFKTCNLLQDLSWLGSFDIIFLRNVLIYFDQPTKSKVLDHVSRIMASDSMMLLGGAETVLGINNNFRSHEKHHNIYMRANGQAAMGYASSSGR
ncbi:MAG: CheR family methyltransferase [Alphaproteobacteria bacterium]